MKQVILIFLVIGYSFLFKINFGYWGISKVNDYNKFSQLIHFKLYDNDQYQFFSKKMNDYYLNKSNAKAIENYETIGLNRVFKDSNDCKYAYTNLHNYINSTFKIKNGQFINMQLIKFQHKLNYVFLFEMYTMNYCFFSFVNAIIILLFISIFMIVLLMLKRNFDTVNKSITIFSVFFVFAMFSAFWGSGNEYGRLLMPFSPFLFLVFVFVFDKLSSIKLKSENQS